MRAVRGGTGVTIITFSMSAIHSTLFKICVKFDEKLAPALRVETVAFLRSAITPNNLFLPLFSVPFFLR